MSDSSRRPPHLLSHVSRLRGRFDDAASGPPVPTAVTIPVSRGLGSHIRYVQTSHLNLTLVAYSIQDKVHEMSQLLPNLSPGLGPWLPDWYREGTVNMVVLASEQRSQCPAGLEYSLSPGLYPSLPYSGS